jgi:hypothetical protein
MQLPIHRLWATLREQGVVMGTLVGLRFGDPRMANDFALHLCIIPTGLDDIAMRREICSYEQASFLSGGCQRFSHLLVLHADCKVNSVMVVVSSLGEPDPWGGTPRAAGSRKERYIFI